MERSVASIYEKLQPDLWRLERGFSPVFATTQEELLNTEDETERQRLLGAWLQGYQPCLFGRISAKWDLTSYCFLDEYDLAQSDGYLREKLQASRTAWTRLAYQGKKSGFIILAASRRLANANPDEHLLELALRLCSLYLLEPIHPNRIYMDEVFLELPGLEPVTWRWNVGANFFGAAGDGRWWQDHRIPGGLGFSMNSVGHLVKSTIISGKMSELESLLGVPAQRPAARSKISSLPKALEMAMRTIDQAALTPSGRATELLPMPSDETTLPVHPCPAALPDFLKSKNYCEYQGFYHTDQTVPAEYFRADIDRPGYLTPKHLDFTYLFQDDIDNPDFITTAAGRRIRALGNRAQRKNAKSSGRMALESEIRKAKQEDDL